MSLQPPLYMLGHCWAAEVDVDAPGKSPAGVHSMTMPVAPQPSKAVYRVSQDSDEPTFFWRPFSNQPARHVLDTLPQISKGRAPATATALFLGCTDPRTLIKSLSVLPSASGGAKHPVQLTAVLNDVHVPTLARTAVLLLMAAELDPNSKADMQLLYDVWFNLVWASSAWPRFAAFTQRLIDGSVPWLKPLKPEDQQQLQEVWRWWLDEKHPKRPTPYKLKTARESFNARHDVSGVYRQVDGLFPLDSDIPPRRHRLTGEVLNRNVCDLDLGRDGGIPGLSRTNTDLEINMAVSPRMALEDMGEYMETGSLSWDWNSRAIKKGASCPVNITFTQPGSGVWDVHPDLRPFTCWGKYSETDISTELEALRRPMKRQTGVLAAAFITRMATVLQEFKSNTVFGDGAAASRSTCVALQVQLVCGEGLSLCLNEPLCCASLVDGQHTHSPLPAPISKASRSDNNKGSSKQLAQNSQAELAAPPFMTFDIIDTGSLCDDVGLLPLLVAVTPRLSSHPAARLHTVPASWCMAAPRMDYYLQYQALGMPLTMTPTLLGLRLVTDITYGRPGALDANALESDSYDPRELSWAPVPPSQPRPQLQFSEPRGQDSEQSTKSQGPGIYATWGPAGSLAAALQSVCSFCCCNDYLSPPQGAADVSLALSTPQTFAWLLVSCIPRLDMSSLLAHGHAGKGPAGSKSSARSDDSTGEVKELLQATRVSVAARVPAHFRVAFEAAMDAVLASIHAATGCAPGSDKHTRLTYLMLPVTNVGVCAPGSPSLRRPYLRALVGSIPTEYNPNATIDRTTARNMLVEAVMGQMFGVDKYQPGPPGEIMEWQKELSYSTTVKGYAVTGKKPPAGVHILDSCGAAYSQEHGWEGAFLLPADYADLELPPKAVLILSTGRPVHVAPLQAYRLQQAQEISPVLAQCLLWPLLSSSEKTPTNSTETTSSTETTRRPSLQVVSLLEDALEYKVVLRLQDAGLVTAAGLQVELPQSSIVKSPSATSTGSRLVSSGLCPSSHVVEVSLKQPAGISTQLVLGWPVAAGLGEPERVVDNAYSSGCGVAAKLKRSEGLVELTLNKAQVWERWPEDAAVPVRTKPLGHYNRVLNCAANTMFMHHKLELSSDVMAANDPSYQHPASRGTLKSFVCAAVSSVASIDGVTMLAVFDRQAKTRQQELIVLLSDTYLVDANDGHSFRIPAVVFDVRYAHSLEEQRPFALKIVKSLCDAADNMNEFDFNTQYDAGLIRRYLWHNAQRWEANEWQKRVLRPASKGPAAPHLPPWFATFISPLHIEHMQSFGYGQRVFQGLFPTGVTHPGEPLPYPWPHSTTSMSSTASGSKKLWEASSKAQDKGTHSKSSTSAAAGNSASYMARATRLTGSTDDASQKKAKGSAFKFTFGGSSNSTGSSKPRNSTGSNSQQGVQTLTAAGSNSQQGTQQSTAGVNNALFSVASRIVGSSDAPSVTKSGVPTLPARSPASKRRKQEPDTSSSSFNGSDQARAGGMQVQQSSDNAATAPGLQRDVGDWPSETRIGSATLQASGQAGSQKSPMQPSTSSASTQGQAGSTQVGEKKTSSRSGQITEQERVTWLQEKIHTLMGTFPEISKEEAHSMAEVACKAYLRAKGLSPVASSTVSAGVPETRSTSKHALDTSTASTGLVNTPSTPHQADTAAAARAFSASGVESPTGKHASSSTAVGAVAAPQEEPLDEMQALLAQMYGDGWRSMTVTPEVGDHKSATPGAEEINSDTLSEASAQHGRLREDETTSASEGNQHDTAPLTITEEVKAGDGSNEVRADQKVAAEGNAGHDSQDTRTQVRQVEIDAEKHSCASCGKSGSDLLACGRCKQACYCDVGCQRAHWKTHKKQCKGA